MARKSSPSLTASRPAKVLTIGFVPLADCAPLVAAAVMGTFTRHGLNVRLRRQPGWASIRDGLTAGRLEAAHAPAALAFGPDASGAPGNFSVGILLSTQGNSITLSRSLKDRGVRDGADLLVECRARRQNNPVTLAAVARYSMHMVLLRQWLASSGINPDKDLRIVTLPARQMTSSLAAGYIDGFCAGEPWNTLAAAEGTGWTAATSADILPGHPEKGLLLTRETAATRYPEYLALIRALQESAAWCDSKAGRRELPALLSRPEWLDLPEAVIRPVFAQPDSITFHRDGAGEPTPERAAWTLAAMRRQRVLPAAGAAERSLIAAFDHTAWLEAQRAA